MPAQCRNGEVLVRPVFTSESIIAQEDTACHHGPATGRSQAVGGVVSVSASDVVAAHLLPPLIRELHKNESGITIELISSNALSDLLRREADIAFDISSQSSRI